MSKSDNVFLVGPMGAGKSTIGRLLAAELRLPFKDSDEEIERRCGADIAWIFDREGEQGFRDRESAMLQELAQRRGIVLSYLMRFKQICNHPSQWLADGRYQPNTAPGGSGSGPSRCSPRL